jgi:hypothetical protein
MAREADPEERYWAGRMEEFTAKSLTDIHGAAEKWAGSISALVGVFGIAGLIKGREEIDKLSDDTKLAVAVLVAIALLLAFIAIYMAALAAQGMTARVWTVADFEREYKEATAAAAGRLKWSRLLVIPATLALAIAVGLMWFGPADASNDGTSVVLVRQGGAAVCGQLVDEGGSLSLETDEGTVPIEDATAVTPVDACPE